MPIRQIKTKNRAERPIHITENIQKGKKRNMKINTEQLLNAVNNSDTSIIHDHVTEYRNKCMEMWTESNYEELQKTLQTLEQNFARMERTQNINDEKAKTFYQIGRMQGIIQVFKQLLRETERQSDINELMNQNDERINKIMQCLYYCENNMGMRHNEIIRQAELSDDDISDVMGQMLIAGAIDCMCIGKTTWYALTKTGRKYYKQIKTKPQTQP